MWQKVAALSGTYTSFNSLSLSLCVQVFPYYYALQICQSLQFLTGVAALGLGTYGAHGFKPKNPSYKEVNFFLLFTGSFNSYIDGFIHSLLNSEKAHYFCFVIVNLCVYVCIWGLKVWHTASLYHLVHTAALLAAPITTRPNIVSIHSFPLFLFIIIIVVVFLL